MTEILGQKMVEGSVEKWRKFFEGAGVDICTVIEYAILVAASDCPNEFRRRRDKIAERLYTQRILRCSECDSMALAEPRDLINDEEDDDNHDIKGSSDEAEKNRVTNYSYDEAEALTEEMEEESQALREVFRIKDILANPDESNGQLHESLRRLELMQLTVENLKATEIGKQVNLLRKHNSKAVRSMVKKLVRSWKDMVDEWVKSADKVAAAAIAGTSSVSVSPSTVDYESGLPSPPLEEGAFLATQTTSVEISQIFEGMDDDGNLCVPEKLENEDCKENEKQFTEQEHLTAYECSAARNDGHYRKPKATTENIRNHQGNMLSSANRMMNSSGPGRPPVGRQQQKTCAGIVQQKSYVNEDHNKPSGIPSQQKISPSEVRIKMEEAKRKFNERYQMEEKAKKQRTIQVMELQDLPKQGPNHVRPSYGKPVPQHHRQWGSNRRY